MKISKKNYAKGLVAAAEELGLGRQLIDEARQAGEKLLANSEVLKFLNDAQVEMPPKKEAIAKLFPNISEPAKNFLIVLIAGRRLNDVDQIIKESIKIFNEKKNIIEAEAISPEPIDETTGQKIADTLEKKTGRKVKVKNRIDKSLIGGLVIKIGDTIIDSSIQGKIRRLKDKIKKLSS